MVTRDKEAETGIQLLASLIVNALDKASMQIVSQVPDNHEFESSKEGSDAGSCRLHIENGSDE